MIEVLDGVYGAACHTIRRFVSQGKRASILASSRIVRILIANFRLVGSDLEVGWSPALRIDPAPAFRARFRDAFRLRTLSGNVFEARTIFPLAIFRLNRANAFSCLVRVGDDVNEVDAHFGGAFYMIRRSVYVARSAVIIANGMVFYVAVMDDVMFACMTIFQIDSPAIVPVNVFGSVVFLQLVKRIL